MFSTGEYDYIKNLTIDYYNRDYISYLCITNNPTNYSNNNVYDVICYYSKEDMSITNSQLLLSSNTEKCEFDSNNYSDNNTIDKLSCTEVSGIVNLSTKEYIYSNLDNYSDIIAEYRNRDLFYKSSYIVLLALLSIMIISFLYKFISKILKGWYFEKFFKLCKK